MRKTKKFSEKLFYANGLILVDGTMSYRKIVKKMQKAKTSYVIPTKGEIDTKYMRFCPSVKIGGRKGGYIFASGAGHGAFLVKCFARKKYAKTIVPLGNTI